MTREDAIERFENVKANALVQKASGVSEYWQNEIDGTIEAIDMAIEALHREEAEEKGYCHRILPNNVEVVVRCKDCRHANKSMFCSVYLQPRLPSDFCSYGKMKGGAE